MRPACRQAGATDDDSSNHSWKHSNYNIQLIDMAQKTLGLVHTSATLVPVFAELCSKFLPHVKTFNIVDDSLIKNTIACGELTAST